MPRVRSRFAYSLECPLHQKYDLGCLLNLAILQTVKLHVQIFPNSRAWSQSRNVMEKDQDLVNGNNSLGGACMV